MGVMLRSAAKPARKEGETVKACLEWLHLAGILAWRNNTGGTFLHGKSRPQFVRFGQPGSGDIFAVLPGGKFLSIECKVGDNKPTQLQKDWAERVQAAGAYAIVVYTLEDLQTQVIRMTEES